MALFETVAVHKTFGGERNLVRALSDLNMRVKSGEFVAIMGPSGSGKTTLLNILGSLDRVSSGEVLFNGRGFNAMSEGELSILRRRCFGFVFQSFNLFPFLTVEENVELPLVLDGRKPKERRQRVAELLEWAGLLDRRRHRPGQLSGGEQQRTALCRAVAPDPMVILADEPTGNLDVQSAEVVLDLLSRQSRENGRTVLLVTHSVDAAARAGRVLFLKGGVLKSELSLEGGKGARDVLDALKEL